MNKKRIALLLVISIIVILISGCGGPTVYKYYSVSFSSKEPMGDHTNVFDLFGGQFINSFVDSLLKDSYIEKKPDGTYSFFAPISGENEIDPAELLEDENCTYEINGDLLFITMDNMVISFKKANSDEVKIYKKLVEQHNAEIKPASAAEEETTSIDEATPVPEATPEPETVKPGDYYVTEFTENGETSDFTDGYLHLEENGAGYYYSYGSFVEIHWECSGTDFTLVDVHGNRMKNGFYENGMIKGSVNDITFSFDSNYKANPLPSTSWHAVSWTDPDGVTIDMPFQDHSFNMETNSDLTGSIILVGSGDRSRIPFSWEQHGKAVYAHDSDGNPIVGLYFNSFLYIDYFNNYYILVSDR